MERAPRTSVLIEKFPVCKGMTCDRPSVCGTLGTCQYKSSAQESNELRTALFLKEQQASAERPAEKGKQDFNGQIDGAGYKASFDNSEKPPVDLVWPGFTMGTARVLGYGARRYARGNWMRGMAWMGIMAAILRHSFAIIMGEDVDKESGELHVYHIACEAMFLAYFQDGPRKAEYQHFDDRLYNK